MPVFWPSMGVVGTSLISTPVAATRSADLVGRGSHARGASSEGRLLGELPTDRNAGALGEHGRVHLASLRLEGGVCRGATKSGTLETDRDRPGTYLAEFYPSERSKAFPSLTVGTSLSAEYSIILRKSWG